MLITEKDFDFLKKKIELKIKKFNPDLFNNLISILYLFCDIKQDTCKNSDYSNIKVITDKLNELFTLIDN